MGANKASLREFQAHLAAKLAGAGERTTSSLLGVQSGSDFWLLNLADSGEVVPLTPVTEVPLTKSWFLGVTNIRGNLFAVSDLSAFMGNEPTPQNSASRLLLVGSRYGNNVALLVTRMLGLKSPEDMEFVESASNSKLDSWADLHYRDREGKHWRRLNVQKLLDDDQFMDITTA